jgi:hypothetical protein
MSKFGKCEGGGRRSALRSRAPLTAVVTTVVGSQSAFLLDVSATGARLRGTDLPVTGEDLFVSVDRVIVFGTVVWVDDDERGVAFESALPAADGERLHHAVALAAGLPPDLKAAFDDWTLGFAR